jgi:hypothetical protein
MKITYICLMLLLAAMWSATSIAQSRIVDTISGKNLNAILSVTPEYSLSDDDRISVMDASNENTVSGNSLREIRLALPELLKRGMKIDDYRIIVLEVYDEIGILFLDANVPDSPWYRGRAPGAKRSFSVTLNRSGDHVKHA